MPPARRRSSPFARAPGARRGPPPSIAVGAGLAALLGLFHILLAWNRWTHGLRDGGWTADDWIFSSIVTVQGIVAFAAAIAAWGGTPRTRRLAAIVLLPFPLYEGVALALRLTGMDTGLDPGALAGAILLAHGAAIALLASGDLPRGGAPRAPDRSG